MRLRKIRLAGFKSFVDPTTIEFPGSVVGIVGPNGSGKSNIIDAIRWVMGETSARSLRGDTMADVVFNGSNSRKPVSQASVELTFENPDRQAGGRFAAYNEIAVRRQVIREEQSVYWLNGTRCRRRDIMDVFHGTGLGPRSYAIIEQGMIARVIESKPDELRDFLEEAAGISKYKERRRETENRMRHTLENLERLNDLREELGRRLTHLKRQATLAEKFRALKAEQRTLESELLALQWRTLDEQANHHAQSIAAQQNRLDKTLADQRHVEAELERVRAGYADATDMFNQRYRDVLGTGAEIARAEESIRLFRQRQEELTVTLRRETEHIETARRQIEREHRQREELAARLAHDTPILANLHEQSSHAHRAVCELEEAIHASEAEFETLSARERASAQVMHAEQARIQHLESSLQRLEAQTRTLKAEHVAIDIDASARDVAQTQQQIDAMEQTLEESEVEQRRTQEAVRQLREDTQVAAQALHDARTTLGQLHGRVASLDALQQAALRADGSETMNAWLEARELAAAPRLMQALRTTPGWEHAVETVLGTRLQAVCTDAFEKLVVDTASLEQGTFTAVDARASEPPIAPDANGLPTLRSQVETSWPIGGLLDGVLCAASLDEGLAMRSRLAPDESVITAEGVWFGSAWLHIRRGDTEGYGVLERERALAVLRREIAPMRKNEQTQIHAADTLSEQLHRADAAHATAQQKLNENHRHHAAIRSELAIRTAALEQATQHLTRLSAELAEIATRIEAEREQLTSACARLEHASSELSHLADERAQREAQRRTQRQQLEPANNRWQSGRDEAYELGLRIEGMRSRLEGLQEAHERNLRQLEELGERQQTLGGALNALEEPLAQAISTRDENLTRRTALEAAMRTARTEVENAEGVMRRSDEERQRQTATTHQERETLEQLRIGSQETLVLRKTVEERLEASGQVLDALLSSLEPDAEVNAWTEKTEAIERRITRLGPINLAAIEEHQQQAERKHYLDAQHTDLEEALAMLETAIRKIDRETRIRFRDTYQRVDERLGAIFPRLFSGGRAGLQLTSDDLIEAGVVVMVCPPGKRNMNIHLLSGGEKALTAIALVFAIFELNPAPFCLLDEVDASLDEVNVGRFCALVEEIAQRVQLVLVTHNKVTMETAQQLIGVTMNEPGVSRLVAVDIEEAIEITQQ